MKNPVVMCVGNKVEQAARWPHFTSSLPANVCPVIRRKYSFMLFYLTIDKRYVKEQELFPYL